ncbi:MAG TPA: hypothetical protein VNC78_07920 [Actinomycetota bacterium]|nr:hypothetical protein [Actinomycetota bacterium]
MGTNGRRLHLLVAAAAAACLVISSTAGAGAAPPKKKRVERVETRDYVGGSGLRGAYEGTCDAEPVGCVIFTLEKNDRYVDIDIADAAGMPVWASVYIYGYTDGHDIHEHVCGSSETPLAIGDGVDRLVVTATQTTAGATNPCQGPATTGSVTATFSNVP